MWVERQQFPLLAQRNQQSLRSSSHPGFPFPASHLLHTHRWKSPTHLLHVKFTFLHHFYIIKIWVQNAVHSNMILSSFTDLHVVPNFPKKCYSQSQRLEWFLSDLSLKVKLFLRNFYTWRNIACFSQHIILNSTFFTMNFHKAFGNTWLTKCCAIHLLDYSFLSTLCSAFFLFCSCIMGI